MTQYQKSLNNTEKNAAHRENVPLAGLLPEEIAGELKTAFPGHELPAWRVKQIYKWICSGVTSFDEMSNLPVDFRKNLSDKLKIHSSAIVRTLADRDKTLKLQIKLHDSNQIEAVILSDGKNRRTACLSVQAGCASACVFCKTAQLGITRNLSAGEITEQFLLLKAALVKSGQTPEISNIVFMGMGEGLCNLENLRNSVGFFSDKEGLSISTRRITLSTCGIISGLKDFTENGPHIRLALSLVSARNDIRTCLMPINRTNPLSKIKECLVYYQQKHRRRITLELVLLKGINTGTEEADAIAKFAKGLDTVINIIPWNPVDSLSLDGTLLDTPSRSEIERFKSALEQKGLKVTRRFERGRSISGACGQLGDVEG